MGFLFGLFSSILLILLGVVAASAQIIKSRPDAAEYINKIMPYQAIIGAIAVGLGLLGLISMLVNILGLLFAPIALIIGLAVNGLVIGLGFLMGYPLINEHVLSKSAEAKARADEVKAKIIGYQVPAGYAAIGLGVISLIFTIL